MERIPDWKLKQTPDDDTAFYTTKLKNSRYNFDDVDYTRGLQQIPVDVMTWLATLANNYYYDCQIVGTTEYDFMQRLENAFYTQLGKLAKYQAIYDNITIDYTDDKETVYNLTTDSNAENQTDEMPLDVVNPQPTVTEQGANTTTQTGSIKILNSKESRVTMIMRTNEFLNEFITLEQVFLGMFKDCFVTMEVIR